MLNIRKRKFLSSIINAYTVTRGLFSIHSAFIFWCLCVYQKKNTVVLSSENYIRIELPKVSLTQWQQQAKEKTREGQWMFQHMEIKTMTDN